MHLLLLGSPGTQVKAWLPIYNINPPNCKKHRSSGEIRHTSFEGGFSYPFDQAALISFPLHCACVLSFIIIRKYG